MVSVVVVLACASLAFYVIICYIFYKEFEYLARTLEMKIKPDGQFTGSLCYLIATK